MARARTQDTNGIDDDYIDPRWMEGSTYDEPGSPFTTADDTTRTVPLPRSATNPTPPAPPTTTTDPAPPTSNHRDWNEDAFWHELLGSGGQTPDDLANFLTSSGWGEYAKQGGSKRDKLTLPGGKTWDAIIAAGLGGRGYQKLDPAAAANAGYAAGAGAGIAGRAGQGYPPGIQDAISKLLARGFSTPSEDDPAIRDQFSPISRTIDRGAAKTRQAAAERAGAQGTLIGGEGGSFDAEVNSINEHAADTKGQQMGSLIGQEAQARRQDILNALQFAQGEERMALEVQLAEADNELRAMGLQNQRYGMDQQNQQFYDSYARNLSNDAEDDDMLTRILEALGG